MMNRKNILVSGGIAGMLFIALTFTACKKSGISEDPLYPASPKGLVQFDDVPPTPAIASEGSVVTIKVDGLGDKQGQFKFYINQTPAEVVSVTADEVKVKIPITASTGSTAVEIDGQFYYGPIIDIRGKLNIDATFNTTTSIAAGSISGIVPRPAGGYMIFGAFRNYQSAATSITAINGITFVDNNGVLLTTGSGSSLRPSFNVLGATGINGSINSAVFLSDGRIVAGGTFGAVNSRGNIGNITRFAASGALDTMNYDIAGTGANPVAIGPSFNGGLTGPVVKLFSTTNGIVAIGNFSDYSSILYERSTSESPYIDRIAMSQAVRLDADGKIDSSFNLNAAVRPPTSYTSANGYIYDAIQVPNNKLMLVGNFTVFENQPSSRIVRLDLTTGRRDPTFSIGGANGAINKITYNATTRRIMVTGEFTSFNGQVCNGIVMLDENGVIDNTFNFQAVTGGIPNFAAQLNDGKVLVSGTFNLYGGIVRPGFMVLNPDGSLAVGYNNLGFFNGQINGLVEFPSETDPSIKYVMLVGSFTRFDSKTVGNIVKIRVTN